MHIAFSTQLAATSGGGSSNFSLLFFVLLIGGMFWFMTRAQRKQRQRVQQLQAQLTPGQEIMTGSGIYGRVVETTDDRVRVEVSPGVVLTVAKQAVARTVDPVQPAGASTMETGDSSGTTVRD